MMPFLMEIGGSVSALGTGEQINKQDGMVGIAGGGYRSALPRRTTASSHDPAAIDVTTASNTSIA